MYFDGFETDIVPFETLEQLKNIPFVKKFSENISFVGYYVYRNGSRYMLVAKYLKEHWVVGTLSKDIDLPSFG